MVDTRVIPSIVAKKQDLSSPTDSCNVPHCSIFDHEGVVDCGDSLFETELAWHISETGNEMTIVTINYFVRLKYLSSMDLASFHKC